MAVQGVYDTCVDAQVVAGARLSCSGRESGCCRDGHEMTILTDFPIVLDRDESGSARCETFSATCECVFERERVSIRRDMRDFLAYRAQNRV